ncbi:CCR4-NOT regulatory complex component [Tilletia horrida]|nr:CCR4-NOT regulatory complex component [Tilletia horrida]
MADSSSTTASTPASVCVFCGSSPGQDSVFLEAAADVGASIAAQGWRLVYGGGQRGCMGQVSSAALEAGGSVLGVMPRVMLAKARGHAVEDDPGRAAGGAAAGSNEGTGARTLQASEQDAHRLETIAVDSMHERKRIMADQSPLGFIGLPGGFGTFEEVFEMVTWTQLGIHRKPMVLLNINGFFSPLKALIDQAISSGFITESNRSLVTFVDADADWGKHVVEAVKRDHERLSSTQGYWDWNSTTKTAP